MQYTVVIVEDEPYSGQMLKNMVVSLRPYWQILALLQSVDETINWLNNNPEPQIIFLDIELADGNCFSIFEQVQVNCGIIFTTAYNEFALKAFELNSIDYILKPIKENSLLKAIEKFEKAVSLLSSHNEPSINYTALAQSIISSQTNYRRRFLISKRESFFQLSAEEIAYFDFDNGINYAITFHNKRYTINQTLDKTEKEVDPKQFFRVNRQTIVNVKAIDKFEPYFNGKLIVKLVNQLNDKISISRAKATLFKEWMNQ